MITCENCETNWDCLNNNIVILYSMDGNNNLWCPTISNELFFQKKRFKMLNCPACASIG